jgi:uncharacterized protein YbjQ (UPF0145 family)
MLTTTTNLIEGRPVRDYKGLVMGEAILGTNIFGEMTEEAQRLGANAVIGIDIDYENITAGNSGSMLMVSASGTAVVVD